MILFFFILLLLLGCLAFIGVLCWVFYMWISLREDKNWSIKKCVLHSIGALLVLTLLITIFVSSIPTNNGASHCGQGTRYISESHYNPATKTTITDWECVAA